MSTTDAIKAEIVRRVQERVLDLRNMSHVDLKALPPTATESVQIFGKPISVTVYRDNRPNDELLIVVQALRDGLLGSYPFHVEGFVSSSSGEKSHAAEELLWDFS
jgi:hypothetical protein